MQRREKQIACTATKGEGAEENRGNRCKGRGCGGEGRMAVEGRQQGQRDSSRGREIATEAERLLIDESRGDGMHGNKGREGRETQRQQV